MIVCIDVDYKEDIAHVGAILFRNWTDEVGYKEYRLIVENIQEYIPGEFYKRELPCLTNILDTISEPIDIIVVDGYVWLTTEKKGLGAYLYEFLNKKIPVIGVAKNRYKDIENAIEILRGDSQKKLYITSDGIDVRVAADCVKKNGRRISFSDFIKSS